MGINAETKLGREELFDKAHKDMTARIEQYEERISPSIGRVHCPPALGFRDPSVRIHLNLGPT